MMRKTVIKNTSPDPVGELRAIIETLESEGGVGSFSVVPVPGTKDVMAVYTNVSGV